MNCRSRGKEGMQPPLKRRQGPTVGRALPAVHCLTKKSLDQPTKMVVYVVLCCFQVDIFVCVFFFFRFLQFNRYSTCWDRLKWRIRATMSSVKHLWGQFFIMLAFELRDSRQVQVAQFTINCQLLNEILRHARSQGNQNKALG